MIFQLMVVVFFLLIAYVHYVQGFFSAGLSAIYCVIAAVLAVGYQESLAGYLMKFPENANTISLTVIFLAAYVIPKILSDRLIQGNVRFPVAVDKAGAALCGLVAGYFGTAIFALAAQSLPFDASFGMYTRMASADRPNIRVPGAARQGAALDAVAYDELQGNGTITDPSTTGGLWLQQDAMLIKLVKGLSIGNLATGHRFDAVHPDYLTEIFGQRIGTASGGRHAAISPDNAGPVKFSAFYQLPAGAPTMDGMDINLRDSDHKPPEVDKAKTLVVVRSDLEPSATKLTDTDAFLRMSVSNVRLCLNDGQGNYQDYFAVGTCVNNHMVLLNRADDPLMINLSGPQTVDFVFEVDPSFLKTTTDASKNKALAFNDGSFVEMRRYANKDLSGQPISTTLPDKPASNDAAAAGGILRQQSVLAKINSPGAAQ